MILRILKLDARGVKPMVSPNFSVSLSQIFAIWDMTSAESSGPVAAKEDARSISFGWVPFGRRSTWASVSFRSLRRRRTRRGTVLHEVVTRNASGRQETIGMLHALTDQKR